MPFEVSLLDSSRLVGNLEVTFLPVMPKTNFRIATDRTPPRRGRKERGVGDDGWTGEAASHGPRRALVLNEPGG